MDAMATPSARKALLFTAGGVRLALPLGAVREIALVERRGGEMRVRGAELEALSVARALGLPGGPGRYALFLEPPGPPALLADELFGIADLVEAEVFSLPARTVLPDPPPFGAAFLLRGDLYLELSLAGLEAQRRASPAERRPAPPDSPPTERELFCERAGLSIAVPLSLLVQVIEPARVFPVPLTQADHRGLLYHGRALHPVFDAAALLGEPDAGSPRVLLLLDAGGGSAGILVDRVRGVGEGEGTRPVRRPPWDALLSPHGA